MPVKRNKKKHRRTVISDAARAIWNQTHGEKIALFDDGSGLIVNEQLAEALGEEPFIVMLDLRALVDDLETPAGDEGKRNTGPAKVRKSNSS